VSKCLFIVEIKLEHRWIDRWGTFVQWFEFDPINEMIIVRSWIVIIEIDLMKDWVEMEMIDVDQKEFCSRMNQQIISQWKQPSMNYWWEMFDWHSNECSILFDFHFILIERISSFFNCWRWIIISISK